MRLPLGFVGRAPRPLTRLPGPGRVGAAVQHLYGEALATATFSVTFALLVCVPITSVSMHVARSLQDTQEPLQLHTSTDMSELAWWAKLANLCGDTAEGVEVAMSPLGKVEVVQRDLSDYGARYFVVNVWKPSGEKLQIIMVRGATNMRNVELCLQVSMKADPQLGIRSHRGFHTIYTAVHEDLEKLKLIDDSATLFFTGHSMGGAVASLLAVKSRDMGRKVEQVVTFGMPKFTDRDGARALENEKFPLIRVVHDKDLVGLSPMWGVRTLLHGWKYEHYGALVSLSSDSEDPPATTGREIVCWSAPPRPFMLSTILTQIQSKNYWDDVRDFQGAFGDWRAISSTVRERVFGPGLQGSGLSVGKAAVFSMKQFLDRVFAANVQAQLQPVLSLGGKVPPVNRLSSIGVQYIPCHEMQRLKLRSSFWMNYLKTDFSFKYHRMKFYAQTLADLAGMR